MKQQKLFEFSVRTPGIMDALAASGVKWATDKTQLKKDVLNEWPFQGRRIQSDGLEWSILEIDVAPQLIQIIRAAREVVRTGKKLGFDVAVYPVEQAHQKALDILAKLV
jgi:hypothetical protein